MCEWCEENGGEPASCQDCGRMICWDHESGTGDDVITRPYVTASGDVYCVRCGSRMDQEEDDAINEEGGYDPYFDNWYDEDMDFENEESNGVDIGEFD
jgi:hypothetical protein